MTVEQMQNQMDPVYTPARKIHLYHCDHRGLPLALISKEGTTEWCAEYDEWGNLLNEENPHQLQQLIRLPGQQYDEESGLYYNRHRYYDPLQGMDPVYTPARKIHLYHCDHRGLPLALISKEGTTEWCAEYDEWGNLLNEENPHQLQQLIRLPGQQYDEESGLYYNRHRYYDPLQGRYITQDPIGLKGGWNLYGYQLNPISDIDPLGLSMWEDAKSGACTNGLCGTLSAMIGPDKFDSIDSTAYDALNKINSQSICEDKEFAGLICKDNSGRYFSTAPNRGERKGSYPFNSPCPNGTEKVSAYHTHGADSHGEYWDEIFSGKDEKIVKSKDNNIKSFYLGTPSGNFKAIDNHGKEITNRKGLPNVCRVHGNM
ncbi:type IV secretion protein Rhs [Escherichia coli]|nr:type IV secretion protein Rhs [Escherichia coli]